MFNFVQFCSMTISKYICELLYRYDCVIVPDFGAFLTKRVSAQLSENILYPPKKQLSFNQQIVSNDGLLANYISVSENISYEQALSKLNAFVIKAKSELNDKGRLSLNEIGLFTLNHEQNLVFEPIHVTNYLTESFGLSTVRANGVVRKEETVVREALKTEVETIEANTPIAFTPEKRNKFRPYKIAAAAAVAAIAITAVGSLLYVKSIERHNSIELVEGGELVKEEIQNASFALDILKPLPSISVEVDEKETSAEAKNVEHTAKSNKKYFIVAGAFREYINMEKKQAQLIRKGYEGTYIGVNKFGLHQVVYYGFDSRNEAITTLKKIKRTESDSAWLLVTQ